MGSNSHVACGLVHCRLPAARQALTNRMKELFTYGSVGGGGRKPAPYPAVDAPMASFPSSLRVQRRATDQRCSVTRHV
jgi:hypothetical protein